MLVIAGRPTFRPHFVCKEDIGGNSLVVQWLGLQASTAGGTGLIPDQGTKISHAMRHSPKKKEDIGACHEAMCSCHMVSSGLNMGGERTHSM